MSFFSEWMQQQLPVIVTHRGAIDRDMFDVLAVDVQRTSNFSAAAARIRELCMKNMFETQEAYYSHCLSMRGRLTFQGQSSPPPEEFGTSEDPAGEALLSTVSCFICHESDWASICRLLGLSSKPRLPPKHILGHQSPGCCSCKAAHGYPHWQVNAC